MEVVFGVSQRLQGLGGGSKSFTSSCSTEKTHIKVAGCLVELQEHEAQTLNIPVQQSVLLLSALYATLLSKPNWKCLGQHKLNHHFCQAWSQITLASSSKSFLFFPPPLFLQVLCSYKESPRPPVVSKLLENLFETQECCFAPKNPQMFLTKTSPSIL